MDHKLPCPVATNGDQYLDELDEPVIKVEVNDDDEEPINPFTSEIIDEPNLAFFFDLKSEPINYESEINPGNENNFLDLKLPEQNPPMLIKQLASDEIQNDCVPTHYNRLLKYEQRNSEPSNSSGGDRNIIDRLEVAKSTESQPTATDLQFSREPGLQFECKLCSKQLPSDGQLKIHVGICALYHKDRNRFCVICNRKFCQTKRLEDHRLRFHGTEEEKLSLYKFKCHVCPKQYQQATDLRFHVESHHLKKQQVKSFKCPHPNCKKEFRVNSKLQTHMTIHSDLRPFSCSFPSCNQKFVQRRYLKKHFRVHTRERPSDFPVDNSNKGFTPFNKNSIRHRTLNRFLTAGGDQIRGESNELLIKAEVSDDAPSNFFSSKIIEEPNVGLVALKSEPITDESEINTDNENNSFGFEQPEQNPYVLLKRLTSEEIQSACGPQHHSPLLKCEQTHEVKKSTENRKTIIFRISMEADLQFECKLCSKQLQSEAQLKIHVGICALYHEDRNRFCVTCNRKFCDIYAVQDHRLRFHGTEEEKLSLYKFKCHVCLKQFQRTSHLKLHLETHKGKEEQALSKLKCSHRNCGKLFRDNFDLQRHVNAIHSDLRPFSCSFPNCYKKFGRSDHLNSHQTRVHTKERPNKCTVDNCNKTFNISSDSSM